MDELKTGFTQYAGSHFTSTGIFNNRRVIFVIMGVDESEGSQKGGRFTLIR
ncbi:hypothetical protein [Sporosarcina sp. ZBG7A]|uniref:hypothetical protein n=1 Tax=Sporosarcina sp. ZBG7A TaxID=1582223 RepID=UPI00350F8419